MLHGLFRFPIIFRSFVLIWHILHSSYTWEAFRMYFLPCSWKLIGSSPHEVSLCKADYMCWERSEKETSSSALSWCLYVWVKSSFLDRRDESEEKRRINWCFHMTEPLTHVDIWQSHEQLPHLTVPWANACPVACSLSSNFPLFLFSSPFLFGLSFLMAVPLPSSTEATPLSSNWRSDFNHVIIRVGWSQTAKLALSLQLHCDPGESGSTGLVWMSLKTCLTWREMAHFVMIVFLVHKGS